MLMILHLGSSYTYYCYRVLHAKYIVIDEMGYIDFVDRFELL